MRRAQRLRDNRFIYTPKIADLTTAPNYGSMVVVSSTEPTKPITKRGKPLMATNKQEKIGAWGLVSGSKKTGDAVYGVKLFDGQGDAKKSELIKVVNRWGNSTLVRIDKKIKTVGANPVKGEMGYTLYSVEK